MRIFLIAGKAGCGKDEVAKLIKSKFKLSSCFYSLMFQIMVLPMGDNYHFYTATSVLIYALFENLKLPFFKYHIKQYPIGSFTLSFSI